MRWACPRCGAHAINRGCCGVCGYWSVRRMTERLMADRPAPEAQRPAPRPED